MKYNKFALLILCALSFKIFFAGITRHDVKEKKYLEFAMQKQFNCVGQIYKDILPDASCVLITNRFVLTAAHVLMEIETRPDTVMIDGRKWIVQVESKRSVADITKLYVVFNGQKIKAKRIIIQPYYLDSLTQGSCDIALLELEQPVTNILPAKINTGFDELRSNVVGAGYGASGPANKPGKVNVYHKKIAGENTVDSLSGTQYSGRETILWCDFDHPTRKDCNKMGSAVPRPLEYITSGGDSGGGLFKQKGDTWELVGICSGGGTDMKQLMTSGYYGQTMTWTRVSVFANWINEQIK